MAVPLAVILGHLEESPIAAGKFQDLGLPNKNNGRYIPWKWTRIMTD